MSQTVLCIFFIKAKIKRKKKRKRKKSPGAHTQACSATLKSGLKHTQGGVEQKELSASIPRKGLFFITLPFLIGPIREQLFYEIRLSLVSCFLLATVGLRYTHV